MASALVRQERRPAACWGLRSHRGASGALKNSRGLGFAARQSDQGLTLQRPGVFPKVSDPGRAGPGGARISPGSGWLAPLAPGRVSATPPPGWNPRFLQALTGAAGVTVERRGPCRSATGDAEFTACRAGSTANPLEPTPCSPGPNGMPGDLSFPAGAGSAAISLVAIKRRVSQPDPGGMRALGALKETGSLALSGRILNRGASGFGDPGVPSSAACV